MDAAQKLGQKLLSKDKLTASEVKQLVEAARQEVEDEATWAFLKTKAAELAFAVRILDKEKRMAEVMKIVGEISRMVK